MKGEIYGNKSQTGNGIILFIKIMKEKAYMETIISACISAGVTLIVCMISNRSQ